MCAKFYPDRLRFGSTRVKNMFWSKHGERPSLCLAVPSLCLIIIIIIIISKI